MSQHEWLRTAGLRVQRLSPLLGAVCRLGNVRLENMGVPYVRGKRELLKYRHGVVVTQWEHERQRIVL
jgi:hypothetical protein